MEHGLKYITFYVQKHIAPLAVCYNLPLVCDKPLEVPAFVKLVYIGYRGINSNNMIRLVYHMAVIIYSMYEVPLLLTFYIDAIFAFVYQ